MKPYPHVYSASAMGPVKGAVTVSSAGLPAMATAPPAEFDGPGDAWSPETLLVASIADCFVLTFRGVSRAATFDWQELKCVVEGTLERLNGVTRFSRYTTRATLTVDAGADHDKARELLERAEKVCLVANSLQGERFLETTVVSKAK
ncbi:MAG: OsmC family protein [Chromatiales bacterium]|nr:OsmC family protein [Chromatiales bacterium]